MRLRGAMPALETSPVLEASPGPEGRSPFSLNCSRAAARRSLLGDFFLGAAVPLDFPPVPPDFGLRGFAPGPLAELSRGFHFGSAGLSSFGAALRGASGRGLSSLAGRSLRASLLQAASFLGASFLSQSFLGARFLKVFFLIASARL